MKIRSVYTITREMDGHIDVLRSECSHEKKCVEDEGEMLYEVGGDDKISVAFHVLKEGEWVNFDPDRPTK